MVQGDICKILSLTKLSQLDNPFLNCVKLARRITNQTRIVNNTMKVPLLDLKGQYSVIKDEILEAAHEVFESQYFILGPRVESLEKEIADYCFSKHAVGVSDCASVL